MIVRESIKFINAALDEGEDDSIILRGVIDPVSLPLLKVDDYQREILPATRIRALMEGLAHGGVPDIELGMRGGSFTERDGSFYLHDDVYIVDGLQRRTAALKLLERGVLPRLGATVHFNSDKDWEHKRFRMLNVSGVKLSANVLLRNERQTNQAVEMLYRLCNDSTFVLCNRVSWSQRMRRDHLVGGMLLLHTASRLHQRLHPSMVSPRYHTSAENLERLMAKVGRNVIRENVKRFWALMDECFDVRGVVYASSAPYLRRGFVESLCRVFNDHTAFWADVNLDVPADIKKKLASFPLRDPQVQMLCGTSGASRQILYQMIVNHINSGKRSRRLVPFNAQPEVNDEYDTTE